MENENKAGVNTGDPSKHHEINTNKSVRNSSDSDREKKVDDNTDKYLAMEQPGVSYTKDHNPIANSDTVNPSENNNSDKWNDMGGNSKYSEAFNQDDYILSDNIDLDEDQNKSVSSDDDDFDESNERYTN